jgi:hypothetical protein
MNIKQATIVPLLRSIVPLLLLAGTLAGCGEGDADEADPAKGDHHDTMAHFRRIEARSTEILRQGNLEQFYRSTDERIGGSPFALRSGKTQVIQCGNPFGNCNVNGPVGAAARSLMGCGLGTWDAIAPDHILSFNAPAIRDALKDRKLVLGGKAWSMDDQPTTNLFYAIYGDGWIDLCQGRRSPDVGRIFVHRP